MFFDDVPLKLKRQASLAVPPPTPATGWLPPAHPPRLDGATVLSLDVETYDPELTAAGPGWARGRGHVVGVSLAAQDTTGNRGAWYFPLRHTIEPEYNLPAEHVLPWLKTVLETPVPKVGANLLYDIGWLSEEGIFVQGELYDVQFAEALLDEEALVALDVLSWKYLRYGKETDALYNWLRKAYPKTPERQTRENIYRASPRLVGPYAETDALNPLGIIQKQLPLISGEGLDYIFRLECDLIPLLVRMRREGVTVDVALAERMYGELATETDQLIERVRSEYGYSLGSTDSRELGRLFDRVGIPYPKTEAGNPSIEKEWLKALEHPLGELLNDIREHEKIRGTFLKSYIIDKNINGKLYPQFHPLKGDSNGTMVGRFASSDPNLQNIPSRTKLGKKVRTAFTFDRGHFAWRKDDFSQIHYRILAHYAVGPGSDELRERYINDPKTDYHMDVYMKVAPLMGWSTTDKEIIKEKRRPIKNTNFGLLYGQSEKALAYKQGMGKEEASTFFENYFEGAPYVKPTMEDIGREVQAFGYVTTVLGRRVRFKLFEPAWKIPYGEPKPFPLPYEAALREWGPMIKRAFEYRGVNYKFQGSEPDIMKTGMRECLRSGVYDYVGVPRLTVHDECDYSVRDDSPQTREAFAFIKHVMQTSVKLRVPIYVDSHQGPNWGEAD